MSDQDPSCEVGSYEVGYRKPPKSGQFAAGKSGNPKGRPKGSKNLASVVLRESRQMVLVKGPHGSKKVTKVEASLMQLGNKAAQGDLRAQREFYALVRRAEESMDAEKEVPAAHELDHQMMDSILKRVQTFQPSTPPTKTENPE